MKTSKKRPVFSQKKAFLIFQEIENLKKIQETELFELEKWKKKHS